MEISVLALLSTFSNLLSGAASPIFWRGIFRRRRERFLASKLRCAHVKGRVPFSYLNTQEKRDASDPPFIGRIAIHYGEHKPRRTLGARCLPLTFIGWVDISVIRPSTRRVDFRSDGHLGSEAVTGLRDLCRGASSHEPSLCQPLPHNIEQAIHYSLCMARASTLSSTPSLPKLSGCTVGPCAECRYLINPLTIGG